MQPKVSYEDRSDGITVVRVEGDGSWAPELREVLARLAEEGRLIFVVDLSAVEDIDSTKLGALVGGLKRVHFKGGTLALAGAGEKIRTVLAKTRLTSVFRVHDDVPSAVTTIAAEYAEEGVEQRRAAIEERRDRKRGAALEGRAASRRQPLEQGVITRGEYTYEHVSDDVTVVSVANEYRDLEISVYTAPALRTVLVDLVNQGRYFLVVDLAGIAFIDSTGLGVLVGALKRVRVHGGEVAVAVPTVRIGKVFRITGLASVFAQFDTVDAAVEFLGRQAANAYA